MSHSDNGRKRGKESPPEGQQDLLETPPPRKRKGNNDVSPSLKYRKSENDPQNNTDHNEDKYYVKNEVSGIKSYRGLVNQGATCYLNAVLQTLFMSEVFRDAILSLNEREIDVVSFQLQLLFKCLKSKNGASKSATTNGVTKALDIENVSEQQDAAEYYQMILSMIEPEAAKVFQGYKKHLTTCIDGKHDPTEEITSFLSLPIAMDSGQNKIDVQQSFDAQFEVMHMDGDDQLFCESCEKMMDMQMRCTICELPEILTLHLQRFYMDYSYMKYRKNDCPVKIPLRLSAREETGVLHDYELYAVVNHVGSLSGGHYYADIRSFENLQWYEFNDSFVQVQIDQKYEKVQHFHSVEACMLFFRKSTKQPKQEVNVKQERTAMRPVDPEDPVSLPLQDTDHLHTDTENNPDSAVSSEKDTQIPLDTGESSPEEESSSSETMTDHDDRSTPDTSSGAAEASFPSARSEVVSDDEGPPEATLIMIERPEEDNPSSPADQQVSEIPSTTFSKPSHSTYTRPEILLRRTKCKSPQTGIEPEDRDLPQRDRDYFSTDIGNAADHDDHPTSNISFHEDCVIFTTETQRVNPKLHETTHSEPESDNDEAKAPLNKLLEQTNVRRKIPLWVFILFGFILFLILVLVFILPFYL